MNAAAAVARGFAGFGEHGRQGLRVLARPAVAMNAGKCSGEVMMRRAVLICRAVLSGAQGW
jgi:hypothetical protein